MNVVRIPDDKDWVAAYGQGRVRRWLKRRLLRPGYLLVVGLLIGAMVGWTFLQM